MDPAKNLIDLSFLRSFTNNDEEKLKYYIRIYLKTATRMFDELERNKDDISNEELYARAHSLKPQTKYVGIAGLTDLLIEIENGIMKNQDRSEIIEKLVQAIHLNRLGMDELEAYLAAHGG